jgi:mannose-1-phosphate guanylyltransferase
MDSALWTIVLAAGSGRRLAKLTAGVPKQFWKYNGTDTLLGETLARVAPISPPSRTLVVVDRHHDTHLRHVPELRQCGRTLQQPSDRGTAAGVLLPLIQVIERQPDAIVLVTPSDHGVARPSDFHRRVREAVEAVTTCEHEVVLFGVRPQGPAVDFGWITPGGPTSDSGRSPFPDVARFVEKPAREHAEQLFRGGSVWNTMVLVARATALLDLYRDHAPQLAATFAATLGMSPADRSQFLAEAYADLQPADFSRDVLTPARRLALAIFPASMGWSDLGTPDRLRRWIGAGTDDLECSRHAVA